MRVRCLENACNSPEIAALDIEEGRLELSGDSYGGNVVRFVSGGGSEDLGLTGP